MTQTDQLHFDCLHAMRALAEPTRIELVRELIAGPRSVSELCDALSATPYNASKHLRILKEAGLLSVRKQAQHRIYDLTNELRTRLARNRNVLDLGCCQFNFDRLKT
jgi:DNA-binding transcriptional ArsR family regulator